MNNKPILLIGGNGQLGWELQRTLAPLAPLVTTTRKNLDLTDLKALEDLILATDPSIIVNAAAYTAVDQAETDIGTAELINALAPGVMAETAQKLGALLVHYSTDYVYPGDHNQPYLENQSTDPQSIYGKTKLAGEQAIQSTQAAHIIFRTSWVYDGRGQNFLLTMLRLGQGRDELSVVDDQIGTPNWSRMLAQASSQCINKLQQDFVGYKGLYHLTASGQASWKDFAELIFALDKDINQRAQLLCQVLPTTTDKFPRPAPRPAWSVMSGDKLYQDFNIRLPSWQQCLELCMLDMPNN